MSNRILWAIIVLSLIIVVACSGKEDPDAHGREVLPERNEDADCPLLPVQEGEHDYDCYNGIDDECNMHSDCGARANGICDAVVMDNCRCYYHDCLSDSDCPDGKACICQSSGPYRACSDSCRSSDDCGAGQKCVESSTFTGCSPRKLLGEYGYRCTSDSDSCASDYDCPRWKYCVYSEGKGHFACLEGEHSYDACE